MLRGTGEQEKLLKNAKSQYWNEFEEIATYYAIETLAEYVGDKETHDLAKSIRREEERMARYLEKLIPKLTRSTAREEIPAALRNDERRPQAQVVVRASAARAAVVRAATKSSRSRSTKSRARSTKKRARSTAKKARSAAKTARTSARAAKTSAKRSRAGAKGGRKRAKSGSR